MKALARSYLWWPKLDQEIETKVRACGVCQSVQKSPPVAPLHPWNWPSQPWQRLHIDHFECEKSFYLVVIDSHSKWIEVVRTKSMTAAKTIEILRNLFSSYGLPETIVSDNGPGFASKEFRQFTLSCGVQWSCGTSRSNGQKSTIQTSPGREIDVMWKCRTSIVEFLVEISLYATYSNGTIACKTVLEETVAEFIDFVETKFSEASGKNNKRTK